MTSMKNSSDAYSAAASTSSSRLATAGKDVMVGLKDNLLAIKEQLCGSSSRRQVIPIVGMGGIGKTTLARNAYHDPLTRHIFYIRGWVTVSQSYSLEDILSRLLSTLQESLQPFDKGSHVIETQVENSESSTEVTELFENKKESTEDQIYKTLKGMKYLIVLDDIWNTEVFDRLHRLFPDGNNGSRVILTTRLLDLATYAKDCSPHEMQLMSEYQSWNLLQQKVFTNGVCYQELENIGMAIARSCGGLPLAIVAIAGLLTTVEKTQSAWEEIAEKVSSTVAAKDGQFERMLSLSYTHLPHHLRQCFVYMGGFPEDHEIQVAKLIKLWIAEGFLDATTATKCLEQEAGDYLLELIKRSLVLVGERKPHGEMKSCRLHDLMRDLCIRKADEEKFPVHDTDVYETYAEMLEVDSSEEVRYPRVIDFEKTVPSPSLVGPELYTLAPEKKFRLFKLRYISLAHYVDIPAAISCLRNLQTFIIYPMEGFVCLPQEIWEMPQLRHLDSSFDPLPYPDGEARMENLQTLSEVSNLELTDMLVERIPNIKKLRLLYSESSTFQCNYFVDSFWCLPKLEDLFHYYDYHLENLERLQQLEKLKIRVYPGFQGILNPVFPLSLKKLSLSCWKLPSWNEMKIIGSLPNLQVLKLIESGGQDERWETAEGEFPRLSFLFIERSDLQEWITEPEHFPNLKQLLVRYCGYLEEIPAGIGDIPTLELIEVKGANTLLIRSVRRIEEEQKEMANDRLQIRCT